ncbi:MAG: hypothetical protein IJH39_04025 [Clostridia bacterium]|nr:hypothetical protein [Clostridia bacterium]
METGYYNPVYYWNKGVKYDYSKEYLAHSSGYVLSLYTGKKLTPYIHNNFYAKINLYKDKKPQNVTLHKVICSSFPEICGEYFDGAECNHKDENIYNNSATNLEFIKPIVNKRYGTRIARIADKTKNGKKSKIVLQYDLNNNLIKEWESVREIERILGYCHSNILRCCNGKLKQAYGFVWKYKETA